MARFPSSETKTKHALHPLQISAWGGANSTP